jgi:hypothetical protein
MHADMQDASDIAGGLAVILDSAGEAGCMAFNSNSAGKFFLRSPVFLLERSTRRALSSRRASVLITRYK